MNIFLEHIAIVAKDPDALMGWYQRVLGAKPIWNNRQNPPTCLVSFGSVWFEIYPADKLQANREITSYPASGTSRCAWNRSKWQGGTGAARCEIFRGERPAAGGGRVLFFEDPEGNLLHFVERLKDTTLPKS